MWTKEYSLDSQDGGRWKHERTTGQKTGRKQARHVWSLSVKIRVTQFELLQQSLCDAPNP
eukprot:2581442-Amphidinium_carterae.1